MSQYFIQYLKVSSSEQKWFFSVESQLSCMMSGEENQYKKYIGKRKDDTYHNSYCTAQSIWL